MEYAVADYGSMIADTIRMDAYAAALERVVTPGSVVVDLGTGTGIAALLACRLGARRVFAIDPSPVIEVARQAARDNGYADRIEFFEESATRVELPEPADIVVSDLRGVLPLHTVHLEVLEDARRRLLKPGGVLIPQRDTLWAALAEAPREIEERLGPWRTHARGFDFEAARTLVANNFWKARAAAEDALLSEPSRLATLDYSSGGTGDVAGSLSFSAARGGLLSGLYMWFDTVLVDGIGFSNAPGLPDVIYGRAFFPLLEEVQVSEGEEVEVDFGATLVADDYVYRWSVRIGPRENARARFRQSSFAGFPLSGRTLRAADESHAPSLSPRGILARRALELIDGRRTAAEIAEALEVEAGSREEALGLVTGLLQKYGA